MAKSENTFAKGNAETQQRVLERLEADKPKGGRTTEEEAVKEQALAEHIAGASANSVEVKYRLAAGTIGRMIKQRFETVEEYYEFLEGCMLQNATLASAIFAEKASELQPSQAAAAAASFTKTAVELRKARVNGFKEEPVPVNVLIKLQQALAISTNAQ